MCCTGHPLKGPCGLCPALAKVRRDVASKGMFSHRIPTNVPIVRSSRYEGPSCSGVFGKSLRWSILNTEKPPWKSLLHYRRRSSCALLTPATASRRKYVGICKGLIEKTMGGGMNMTMEELTTLLNAWPRSSGSPDEVILLDYCHTSSMAIVFTTNRFLETATLIFVEQHQVGIPPCCTIDGTGRVIWQRTRVLLLGGLTTTTPRLSMHSASRRRKKESHCNSHYKQLKMPSKPAFRGFHGTGPLDPVPPISNPSGIVVAAPSRDHPTSPTQCPSVEEILADVCEAPSYSQGSFRPSLSEVEALLGNDWRPPLHVTVPGLSPQQFEFEARHFRDLTTESCVTDCAQIVVYYWWAAQSALSADWDTMGVAWVVRDSLWNASCANAQRRKQLVGLWAGRTLEASSIDMSFAPPLIVVQVYNLSNSHRVLRLLLIAPTREYLCLKFDPMCDRPHIVGANQEELAVVDLIAEREGVEPQQRKKWSKILDAFGAHAFAIAPLHSTFIQHIDGVSCHPA